jgi:hypothetical protein
MNMEQKLANNVSIVNSIRQVALRTILSVSRKTESSVTLTNDNAEGLDNNIKLVGSIVKYELTRRFGV